MTLLAASLRGTDTHTRIKGDKQSMVWWSVNPRGERFRTVSAALALAAEPKDELRTIPAREKISSIELAEAYNNAESLGLDLNSIGYIPDEEIEGKEGW